MLRKKIAFHTFGCKLNFAEASHISRLFDKGSYEKVSFKQVADIYVIQSCCITGAAEKKCKTAIRQAVKKNPEAIIAVIGCYSQINPDEIADISGVDIILGTNEKYRIKEYIENLIDKKSSAVINNSGDTESFTPSYSVTDRTRCFLKIQDGCDYFCSYCTIPLARGRSRSNTIAATVETAKEIAKTDIKEIVLTGINIGDFGKNNNETLTGLLRELDKIDGIDRIRISSIEPDLLKNEIIEFIAQSDKFLPHFHVPMQAGSDKILKAMNRRYDKKFFEEKVKKIKSLMPYSCIATDVLTGFPSETEEDFNETYNFIKGLDISYMHVFTFSERKNTKAEKIAEKVTEKLKHQRSKMLHELSEYKKSIFYRQNINRKSSVLFESSNINGFMSGFTENYIKVKTRYNRELINKIINVTLENIGNDNNFVVEL